MAKQIFPANSLLLGSVVSIFFIYFLMKRKKRAPMRSGSGYVGLIGNTPVVVLKEASLITKCNIIAKMESMNPGGTGKDRATKHMLECFIKSGKLKKGDILVEGTSGSTGISLACLCKSLGFQLIVVIPDDQAIEKKLLLEKLGAIVKVVPSCSISNPNHYVNHARTIAKRLGGIFVDQFENLNNYQIHEKETGPEIWTQLHGNIDAFVMSSGTGGTIAGVSRFLKSKSPSIKVVLADPQGSSLHSRVAHGVCFTTEQREASVRKHRYDSIVEGVGLDRITANFEKAIIDSSEKVTDQEVLEMAHWIYVTEGLFLGSSSALNLVAACRVARQLGPGHTVVTIICDGGHRHLSRFWNSEYVQNYGLTWPTEYSPVSDALALNVSDESIDGALAWTPVRPRYPLPKCLSE